MLSNLIGCSASIAADMILSFHSPWQGGLDHFSSAAVMKNKSSVDRFLKEEVRSLAADRL